MALCDRNLTGTSKIAWRTDDLWRPLSLQLHYFDFLNQTDRSEAWKFAVIRSWIQSNPVSVGNAWTAYPVSLRMVNWIKFFTGSRPIERGAQSLESLYVHALWLEENLERHILANHYLKNAKALLFAGIFFEGRDAERWYRTGLEIVLSQVSEQFLSDGGHYERSPMYHAIGVEDLLDAITYLRTVRPVPTAQIAKLEQYARASLDFLSFMQMPDGEIALFNDSARGVGPSPAELFAYGHTTIGYDRSINCGIATHALRASGYYVIRDGSSMLVIDCGPLGPDYQPGHAHCDLLSYELTINGERIAVDPGVFDYENNAERRYARSTAAHNTVQIDGAEQAEMWDNFRVGRRAYPIAASLSTTDGGIVKFVGAHDGFRRIQRNLIHERTVRYENGAWSFEDRIDGRGDHAIESRVHFRPGLSTQWRDGELLVCSQHRILAILRPSSSVTLRVEETSHFPTFGVRENALVAVMSWHGSLPTTLGYTLEAYAP